MEVGDECVHALYNLAAEEEEVGSHQVEDVDGEGFSLHAEPRSHSMMVFPASPTIAMVYTRTPRIRVTMPCLGKVPSLPFTGMSSVAHADACTCAQNPSTGAPGTQTGLKHLLMITVCQGHPTMWELLS